MRNILQIDLKHLNHQFSRSADLTDLEIGCSIDIRLMERGSAETAQAPLNHTTQPYTPQDKDKLYFLPGTNVPRIKLRDLGSTQGIKTTRNIESANAIFGSKHTFNKLIDISWEYAFSTVNFKQWVDDAETYFQESRDYEKLKTALEHYSETEVIVDWNGYRLLRDESIPFSVTQNAAGENIEEGNSRYISVSLGREEIFKHLVSSPAPLIYDESEILRHVNGASCVTIDKAIFDNLRNMFDSSDSENHLLAMEIMANSNYADSILYLEMLFIEYHHTMYSVKERNHVNFKSLLSYLDKNRDLHTSIDDTVRTLSKCGKLNKEAVTVLLNHMSGMLHLGGSSIFSIRSVSMNPEWLEEMQSNLNYRLQDDTIFDKVEDEEIPTFDNTTVDDQEELEEHLGPQAIVETDQEYVERVAEIEGEPVEIIEPVIEKVEEKKVELVPVKVEDLTKEDFEIGTVTPTLVPVEVKEQQADEEADMIENEEIIQEREADYVQEVLDKASEEGSEEFMLPEIDDIEAKNELEAQAEFNMIDAKNEELNLDTDGGFDI